MTAAGATVRDSIAPAPQRKPPALECMGLSVSYGPVKALDDVTIGFDHGRIHAVVGQNGAGKTTFGRVCAGLVRPDSGRFLIDGVDVATGKVRQSRALGVELVHQNFALPPSFSVAEVMEFGSRNRLTRLYGAKQLRERWTGHLRSLGLSIDPGARVGGLPVELRQGIEIAKALVNDARILILDEPTAVLTPGSIDVLFDRIRLLKARGVTVLLILHKLREVLRIADTVSVLRGGRLVEGPVPAASTSVDRLAASIIGAETDRALPRPTERKALVGLATAEPSSGERTTDGAQVRQTAIEVTGISSVPDASGPALQSVSLRIAGGEILGIAGVEGNGQRQLVEALAGVATRVQGSIRLDGREIAALPLRQRRAAGLRIIPFERNVEGLSLASALWENVSMGQLLSRNAWRFVAPYALRQLSHEALTEWSVRFASVDQPAASLSGGNAQKVILAREITGDARFIVAAQPTRGLDIAATAFVWEALRSARDRGCAILLISSDLDELFDICDRVAVMYAGRIVSEFAPPFDLNAVGVAMTGAGT